MKFGDLDGHGIHGQLTVTDDGERVVCHDCGVERRQLGSHIYWVHHSTAAEYRRAHGLSTGQSLASPATSARHSARTLRSSGSLAALREHTDSDRARAGMTVEGQRRPQLVESRRATGGRARLGRPLAEDEFAQLEAAPDVVAWTATVRRLVAQDGVTNGSIARATGVPSNTVATRLRVGRDLPPGGRVGGVAPL